MHAALVPVFLGHLTPQVLTEPYCVLQWPTRELCPLCMLPSLGAQQDINWNEDEVYRFLVHFYQGSSPGAGLDVTGAAAGYREGSYSGRCLFRSIAIAMKWSAPTGVDQVAERSRVEACTGTGSQPQAGLAVTGAAAGYQDGGYAGR